ncbi:hypothetical protein P121_gp11 [Pelagibacter phage HTVC121P]|nr:hypothetical protein P121_gp11 [Pelagibacter phage HTVC121P]|tara:strand:+ start:88 stop:309 length:222 start_codon:yes stop_codon:yes gene_type:complete
MDVKAKSYEGFSVKELIGFLQKIEKRNPKAKILVEQLSEGQEPLNVIQEPMNTTKYPTGTAVVLNSLYEEEFI